MIFKLERSEVIEAIRYTAQHHGRPMARELAPGFKAMAQQKTPTDQLEAKVNAALRRKHGGVFAIFRRGE